jgi:predicted ArsR family transcriptional regulator
MAGLRMSAARQLVLGALLNAPGELFLSQVAAVSGLPPATADRALKGLLREGVLESRREKPGVRRGKPRHYYRLTSEGAQRALVLLYDSDGDGRTAR